MSALSDLLALLWGAGAVAGVYFGVEILRSRRAEQSIASWLLLIALVPPLGVAAYLVFGARKLRRRAARRSLSSREARDGSPEPLGVLDRIARSHGSPPPTAGNRVALCGTALDAHRAVLELIDGARERIWVASYIFGTDAVALQLVRRLAARAAAGVDVRLLIDAIGSSGVGTPFLAPLYDAGGRVAWFMPVSFLPRPRRYANLRNHRKAIVVDGRAVWTGGMNLAEQYLGPTDVEGRFRDLSFVIEGGAAADYARIFASDWAFATGEDLPLPPVPKPCAARPGAWAGPGPGTGGTAIQVVPTGPDSPGDPLHDVILGLVNQASKRLWIVTPYFIPDGSLLRALLLAVRRGVDVRLVTNLRSDLPLLDFANVPYLRALARVGGRTLRIEQGMVHAKAIVADGEVALAGTANLDQRSLFLNFETMALFHDPADARAIEDWIERLFPLCRDGLPPAGALRQAAEGAVRLFAPIL
jgi:cardiolipin synthase